MIVDFEKPMIDLKRENMKLDLRRESLEKDGDVLDASNCVDRMKANSVLIAWYAAQYWS